MKKKCTNKYNKNWKTVQSFVGYCTNHPEMRFWQALHCWSGCENIYVFKKGFWEDTFYWEDEGGKLADD